MVERPKPVRHVALVRLELAQVLPDAEAPPRARDDDRANVGRARSLERGRERLVHRRVEGVQDVGSVEREREDGSVTRRLDSRHARL